MKRTTQNVVDTVAAQEAADYLALLSGNLADAVELQADIPHSLLLEDEREKEEKDLPDSEQAIIDLAAAGDVIDIVNSVALEPVEAGDQQSYENYANETGGGMSSSLSPALVIGGGVLAVAGVVALADNDDDSNNNNNNDGDGGDGGDTPTPNNAPTLASVQTQTVAENGEVTFTVNASDDDGDDLVYSASSPSNGTVTQTISGTFKYEPNPDFSGNDTFSISVSDGRGGTDSVPVNITISPAPNEAPVFDDSDDSGNREVATDENTDVIIQLNASDVDGDDLTFTLASATTDEGGTVRFLEGSADKVVYSPAENYVGPDSFDVTVNDGNGGTATQTINMRVDIINDAPIARDDSFTVDEDGTVTLDLLANDSDPDNALDPNLITLSDTEELEEDGTLEKNADGTFTYTPNANFNGSDSFTYTLTDPNDATSEAATVSITVEAVNDAPVNTVPEDQSTGKNEPLEITGLRVSDVDIDDGEDGDITVTLSVDNGIIDATAAGSATITDNGTASVILEGSLSDVNASLAVITYRPDTGFSATDTLTITSNDNGITGSGGEETATDTVSIAVDNTPAVIDGDTTGEVTEDDATTTATGTLTATDADNDDDDNVFEVQTDTVGTYGSFSITEGGEWTYTLDDDNGDTDALAAGETVEDVFSVASEDGTTADVTITVTGANDDPVAEDDSVTINEDIATAINVLSNDVDVDDTLDGDSVTIDSNPTNGSVAVNSNGTITYTPNANYNGDDSFSYTITDAAGASSTASVSVEVNAVNDAVTIDKAQTQELVENTGTVTFSIDATDPDTSDTTDPDTLTYAVVDNPQFGSLTSPAPGQFEYTPNSADFVGRDTVRVRVSDGVSTPVFQVVNIFVDDTIANGIKLTSDIQDLTGTDGDDRFYGVLGSSSDPLNLTTFTTNDSIFASLGRDTLFLDVSARASGLQDADLAGELSNLEVLQFAQGDNQATLGVNATDAGFEEIIGNSGDDNINAASFGGDITLEGLGGNDTLIGGIGNDTLLGGEGNDLLVGNEGDDTISDGNGMDIIGGLTGNDDITLNADAVLDEVHFRSGDGSDTVTGFEVTADGIFFLDGNGSNGSVAFAKENSAGGAAGTLFTAGDTDDYEEFAVAADFTANANGLSNAVALLDDPAQTDALLDSLTSSATNTYLVVENATTNQVQILFDDDWSSAGDYEIVATFTDLADTSGLDVTNFGIY